jgi:hypothetical protein
MSNISADAGPTSAAPLLAALESLAKVKAELFRDTEPAAADPVTLASCRAAFVLYETTLSQVYFASTRALLGHLAALLAPDPPAATADAAPAVPVEGQ